MSESGGGLHTKQKRVVRAQTHGTRFVLNRQLRFTKPDIDPAAVQPCGGQVRIEHKSPIDISGTSVDVADNKGEGNAGRIECHRVVPAQLSHPPSKPCGFRDLICSIGHPPMSFTLIVASRRQAIRGSETLIEVDGFVDERKRLTVGLPSPLIKSRYSP